MLKTLFITLFTLASRIANFLPKPNISIALAVLFPTPFNAIKSSKLLGNTPLFFIITSQSHEDL